MLRSAGLGFPRIGLHRELKRALESYWADDTDAARLHATSRELRLRHWKLQRDAGINCIPSNDFSWYDHVLDTAILVGAIPERYAPLRERDLDLYFAMARGRQDDTLDLSAMEMTKWFDTNYHYIVPEFTDNTRFVLNSAKPVDEFLEAKLAGITTRPVILGPLSFLLLGKTSGGATLEVLLDQLIPVYRDLLAQLASAGADWVQLDEPCLVTDLPKGVSELYTKAYEALHAPAAPRIMLATYFGGLGDNLKTATQLPVAGLHIDLVRAPGQIDDVLNRIGRDKVLSLGVVDGRNIWKANLDRAASLIKRALAKVGEENIQVAPSCSLLHVPVSLSEETALDSEIKSWLAFATEKLDEVAALCDTSSYESNSTPSPLWAASRACVESRRSSTRIHNPNVASRIAGITDADRQRKSPFGTRYETQKSLGLPLFPTTTIGSFPQTSTVRQIRALHRKGELSDHEYNDFLRGEIQNAVMVQEEIGLDVLVHGEFERNDMVEYFGEQLEGFAFTRNGWVQSYGSRCVKPPIIFGDVSRPVPMTVEWSVYAQSLTKHPMKGMLTGPVTILEWSFVRDDQPLETTCNQIALAIRDEVLDLERNGLRVIQIDEPALREGLPLRTTEHAEYLRWAVKAFQLAASGVRDETQIHTHMCYAEFNNIIDAVAAMDADVISMETSRSRMELLDAFVTYRYPNAIGPGVYDIHSPRIPTGEEMLDLLDRAARVLDVKRLWVNPDCGLKTRKWEEVTPALTAMVTAARTLRAKLA